MNTETNAFRYHRHFQIHSCNDAFDIYEQGNEGEWDGQAITEGVSTVAGAKKFIDEHIVSEKFLDKWVR